MGSGPTETAPRTRGIDPAEYRRIIGGFATGVAVVTTAWDAGDEGMTVNSLTSVSLDPVLLLVCLTKDSRTAQAVRSRGAFVVNLLSLEQRDVSNEFARPGTDHFSRVEVERTAEGLPVIPSGLGHLVCSIREIHEGGDHDIVVGEVLHGQSSAGEPLLFFKGRYGRYFPLSREARDVAVDWFG